MANSVLRTAHMRAHGNPVGEASRSAGMTPSVPDALERHFSPQELAVLWGLDVSTVRRMFQDEPGVLKIGRSNRRDGKRDYVNLRVYARKIRRKVR